MAKADGSVIIATIIDTEGIEKGTVQIKKELTGLGDNAEKANDSVGTQLAGGFKKLGKAIVAAGVVDMLVDFGKEALELGSDLEEVQNVVDVTFETMSDSVNQFAKDAQKSAGLSETMAKQYVGTFGAMADSFGFTEQEAYEMSTALTQLTGDVASFYNLSQDEAATKLKGVFTGETEALKELGVVMTQTALDSYAMAIGFGKTTSTMSEQEKVALRYQFVMDQLSAASGDFVRTQDSWANQSKILSLQWESLMATLGSGLIDALMPGMQFLNDTVMPLLQDVADGFAKAFEPKPADELRKAIKSTEKAVASANDTFQETSESIEVNAIKAGLYRDQLKELEEKGLTTAESQRQYANAVNALNAIYPDLNLMINENTGLLDANSWAQLQNLNTMKERALAAAQMEQYNAQVQAWAAAENAVFQAEANLDAIQKQRATTEQMLQEQTGLTIEQMIAMYNANLQSTQALQNENAAVIGLTGLLNTLNGTTNTLTASQLEQVAQVISLRSQENALTEEIAANKDAVAAQNDELEKNAELYGVVTDEAAGLAEGNTTVAETAVNVQEKVEKLREEYDAAVVNAKKSINSQIGLFADLKLSNDRTTEDILANWESQRVALDAYSANIQKAIDMGLDEALVQQLSDGSTQSMEILNAMVSDTDINVDEINTAFQKTQESRDTVAEVMAGVQTDLADKFEEMEGNVAAAWGNMDEETRISVDSIQRSISSLRGKTIYIDTYHRTFYQSSGGGRDMSSSNPSNYSVQRNAVPYLAKGAVIPPNAPFMAVLGDQRRGTNVEAPLSTIQEAVGLVMQDQVDSMMRGFEALLQENRALRSAVENIAVGDDVIGRAADRYNRKNAIIQGG